LSAGLKYYVDYRFIMRIPFIAANWKENLMNEDVAEFVKKLRTVNFPDKEVLVCPSFVSIISAHDCARGSDIKIGAQDISNLEGGAYTGEVSAQMIAQFSDYVIIGHSERRGHFYDNNAIVNKKILLALKYRIKPILCIGETMAQHKNKRTNEIVLSQLKSCLKGVPELLMKEITIAYEPIWAISSGDKNHRPATPEDAEETQAFIRKRIKILYNKQVAESTRIIYGGSVKPDNIKSFMKKDNIDGALVGAASLDFDSFVRIINF